MEADRGQDERGAAAQHEAGGLPDSQGTFELRVRISSSVREQNGQESKFSFQTIIVLKLADAVQHLRLKPGEAKNRLTLLKALANSLAAQFRPAIEKRGDVAVTRIMGKIDRAVFDQLIEAMAREGLIVEAESPKYVKQTMKYWRLA